MVLLLGRSSSFSLWLEVDYRPHFRLVLLREVNPGPNGGRLGPKTNPQVLMDGRVHAYKDTV